MGANDAWRGGQKRTETAARKRRSYFHGYQNAVCHTAPRYAIAYRRLSRQIVLAVHSRRSLSTIEELALRSWDWKIDNALSGEAGLDRSAQAHGEFHRSPLVEIADPDEGGHS